MANPISPMAQTAGLGIASPAAETRPEADKVSEMGKRFEQMLWAEMLSHSGLEEAFTRGGGEAASSFSRYIVEAIAADLAETHPLGFADKIDGSDGALTTPDGGEGE
ncbi:MAG: hypothetical protein MRY64_00675 [Hyphomonadaceae bacterium]|nr:hypothetical protein [Hyphomonadaceae bacterium]